MPVDFDTPINRLDTGSSKWSRYPPDVLPMWVADMDLPVADEIVDAIRARLDHPVFGYSVATDRLRQQIVADMARKYGWTIAEDDILFLPGVEPGLNMTLKSMLDPGDGILVHTPMYAPILRAPGHWDMERIDVPLRADADGRYRLDETEFTEALEKSRALVFCNPHNPTGKVFARDELEGIANGCLERDVLIISDEIHCELLFDGRKHIPIASLSPEIAARTVTLMSASKTYNIAGLKTGFAIITDAAMRERIASSRLGMVDSVNLIGMQATLAAYERGEAWRAELLTYLQANRDYLHEAIATRFPDITMHRPEGTFLAWLDCTKLASERSPFELFLEDGKVGFSAGLEFGADYERFVRLNFGCNRATLEEGLRRMESALA